MALCFEGDSACGTDRVDLLPLGTKGSLPSTVAGNRGCCLKQRYTGNPKLEFG